ncbi:CHASE2 domain-containing protein, partial [bacterium]|nr:CHASE2 domain-containing protein [bacterium]
NCIRRFKPIWQCENGKIKHFAVSLFENYSGMKVSIHSEKKLMIIKNNDGMIQRKFKLNNDLSMFIRFFNFSEYAEMTHIKPFNDKNYITLLSAYDFIKDFEKYRDRPFFNDSIVLIGPTHFTFHDNHKVPLSDFHGMSKKMPGVEIHANILMNLLDNKHISKWQISLEGKIILGVILSVLCLLKVRWSFTGLLILGISMYAVSIQLFVDEFVYIPVIQVITVCFLTVVSTVFIKYILEIKSKKQLRSVFKQYMNDEVIKELINEPGKISLGGSKKNITVLFADIRGFTSLSEKILPEEVVAVLNRFFESMLIPIEKYRGILDKFMGDCVMVIFGAPIELDNPELNAVNCAFEMIEGLKLVLKEPEFANYNVNIGIGINSGDVVIGNIGTDAHKDYTVIGDNVNLAARLESSAQGGEIVISESVFSKIKGEFEILEKKSINVKGKQKAITVYIIKP